MARIFFDTEFIGLHKDTTLISVDLIDEFENKCYADITDYDKIKSMIGYKEMY